MSSSSSSATAKMVARMQQEQREKLLAISRQSATTSKQAKTSVKEVSTVKKAANIKVEDTIEKKIADIHMQPYKGSEELREAEAASLRAKARIIDLERELEAITKKTIMTSTKALKSARQMAYEANMEAEEEAKASSTKKSRKVIVESSSKIKA